MVNKEHMAGEDTNKECCKCHTDLEAYKAYKDTGACDCKCHLVSVSTPSLEERVEAVLEVIHTHSLEGCKCTGPTAAIIKLVEGEKQGKLSVGGTLDGAYLIGKKEERQRIKEVLESMKYPLSVELVEALVEHSKENEHMDELETLWNLSKEVQHNETISAAIKAIDA